MRIAISMLLGTLLVTGCIFPSFDDMQNGSKNDGDEGAPAPNATEETVKQSDLATDPTPDASAAPSSSSDASPAGDASADVATTPPPGTGKIACGNEQCPVAPDSHCCADYTVNPNDHFYCSTPGQTIGWCTGGGGRVLFCDQKADCPGSQVCCAKGDVTACSATCTGGTVLP